MEFPAWDPVLLDIPGLPIDLRWYGLMYIVGFIAAQIIMVRLARARFFPVQPSQAPDLILFCILGVMLGGRLGYALFYDPDLASPLQLVQVWKGGLAFHGGLAGVVVALLLFAWRTKVPWLRIGDVAALAVTPGIAAVRFANFLNGELFGKATGKDALLAMRFPTDPVALARLHVPGDCAMRDRELCIQVAYGKRSWEDVQGLLSATDSHDRPIDWEAVRPYLDWDAVKEHVPYRYASQLYEMFFEGIVLGLVLLGLYLATRRRPLRHGWYGATFLLGYAAARFCCEFVRQPDPQFDKEQTINWFDAIAQGLGLSMGQFLSTLMVVGGGLILLLSKRRDDPAVAGAAAGDAAKGDEATS